jgi:hypothetical protein
VATTLWWLFLILSMACYLSLGQRLIRSMTLFAVGWWHVRLPMALSAAWTSSQCGQSGGGPAPNEGRRRGAEAHPCPAPIRTIGVEHGRMGIRPAVEAGSEG